MSAPPPFSPLRNRLRVLDLLRMPVWIFDIENACMWWANRAAVTLWNADDLEQLLQRDFASDMSSMVRVRLENYLEAFSDGQAITERWTLFPRGVPHTMPCTCSGIILDDGRLAMLVEAGLEHSIDSDTLRSVEALRHTSVMISLYDAAGRLISRNPAAQRAFGDHEQPLAARFPASADTRAVLSALETLDTYGTEAEVTTRSGVRWHRLDIHRAFDPATGDPMLLVSETDITDRKRTEEQARQQQAELAHMGRLSLAGEMASGLAHEINQPLAAITTYGEACLNLLAAGNAGTGELTEALQEMVKQGHRAGAIIHRLRNFTRKATPQRIPVNLNALVQEVARFMGSDARHDEILLRLEFNEALPLALADPVQIQQVLVNLMRNAMEAMRDTPATERTLTVRTAPAGDHHVEVAVRDSGAGLSADVGAKLFQPFVTTKPEGMGLGLSISKSIVESYRGRLWAVANADRGVTFYFTLPAAGEPMGKPA